MFLTFRFDSLVIHSAGGDGLAQFRKGFGGLADGRGLTLDLRSSLLTLGIADTSIALLSLTRSLLLIEGGDAHHSRHGTLCPCPIGEVPPVQQVDALACGRHPQQLEPEAEAVVTMLSQPHAKAHIQRITSSITLRLQLGFRQHEVVHSQLKRSPAHGTTNINLITFHTFFIYRRGLRRWQG